MKLRDLELIVGNPPPGFGGRYFPFVRLVTDDGILGWGEVFAATVGPAAMAAVIADVFERHMLGDSPASIERMFRWAHSSGCSQRPDPTVIGAFSGPRDRLLGHSQQGAGPAGPRALGRADAQPARSYSYLYPGLGEEPARCYNDPEASAACALRMVEAGFTAVKFDPAGPYTINGGRQPGPGELQRSEQLLAPAARGGGNRGDLLFGPRAVTPDGAIRLARRIAPYDPLWFEEPVPPTCRSTLRGSRQPSMPPAGDGRRARRSASCRPGTTERSSRRAPSISRGCR